MKNNKRNKSKGKKILIYSISIILAIILIVALGGYIYSNLGRSFLGRTPGGCVKYLTLLTQGDIL